ncbi:MAG: histidine phosphatase family protein [Gammaproteobacteria bacterium]|nr:histidine phosphatase family protein [Gammaproteobacteria bacterium]
MKLYCLRHGNTFGEDQEGGKRVFMSGSKNNIPLVNSGREQARIFAQYLDSINVIPTALYANHLIRIWEMAVLIREYFYCQYETTIPLYQDERLLEVDYGNWAGLTTEDNNNEVIKKFGQKVWDDWQNKRIIPNDPPSSWTMTQEEIIENLHQFLNALAKKHAQSDVCVAIGSQGSLTFLNALFEGGMEKAIAEDRYKIKTGRFSELQYKDRQWQLLNWNQDPKKLF